MWPLIPIRPRGPRAAAEVTSWGVLKQYWCTFATLGTGVVLLSAIRQTRQVVIPLWAAHIGLSPTANSIIYGIAGLIDVMTFYPAGKVMDAYGRRWVAVGNGGPRWMIAAPRERARRTRPTGRLTHSMLL